MKKILAISLLFITMLSFAQEKKYQLSSHILDISQGVGVENIIVNLSIMDPKTKVFTVIDTQTTDENGRIKNFLALGKSNLGIYKLTFNTKTYFEEKNSKTFYPFIDVVFEITNDQHYHVPITLSAFGYSTYKGN